MKKLKKFFHRTNSPLFSSDRKLCLLLVFFCKIKSYLPLTRTKLKSNKLKYIVNREDKIKQMRKKRVIQNNKKKEPNLSTVRNSSYKK